MEEHVPRKYKIPGQYRIGAHGLWRNESVPALETGGQGLIPCYPTTGCGKKVIRWLRMLEIDGAVPSTLTMVQTCAIIVFEAGGTMSELSDNIFKLRNEGMSYREIQRTLNCSIGTISYHLGEGQKDKCRARRERTQPATETVLNKKINGFHAERVRKPRTKATEKISASRDMSNKVGGFCRGYSTKIRNNYSFTYQDVVEKAADDPVCYLTGDSIDLSDPRSYEFDHVVPKSRGGSNDLDNLGITTKEANRLKGSLTVEELLDLCEKVLRHHNRI